MKRASAGKRNEMGLAASFFFGPPWNASSSIKFVSPKGVMMGINKGSRPQLPPHLSYKSALVLLPPSSIEAPIEALRRKHDRNFQRWPPHINLIYPFLNEPSASSKVIKARIQEALRSVKPIQLRLSSTGNFLHSKSSATVWISPEDSSDPECPMLRNLQAKLQTTFSECNADQRSFTPHLSIGQARGERGANALELEASRVMTDFTQSSKDEKIAQSVSEEPSKDASWSMEWKVDRVSVIERYGIKDRFKIVDEVLLDITPG